jgi:vaccinia related kinase
MPGRNVEPAAGPETEQPKKTVAPNGNRLPHLIPEGEILTDITKNQWKLGRSIGAGGSGEVYLASSNTYEPVGPDAQYVVKVGPHENGSLFVETNCYLTMAKSDMMEEWMKGTILKHLGLPRYVASGSHVYRGKIYRFLVLERYGRDLDTLFLLTGGFPVQIVFYIGIQILCTLEYIHSHGYIHGDIKATSVLQGYRKGTENCVYLLDFRAAGRYLDTDGVHMEYRPVQSKAHAGTLEYASRDRHAGAFSRRGDLETLGYNMLRWLCGKLPWEDNTDDPEYIRSQKESFMSNIPLLMRQCFPNSEPPAALGEYLKYVASLDFKTDPCYGHCKYLLRKGVVDSGCVPDQELLSGGNSRETITENNNRGNRRRAPEDPDNTEELKPEKRVPNTPRQPSASNRMVRNSPNSPVLPSHQYFTRKKIISANPENHVTKYTTLNRKDPTIRAKHEPMQQQTAGTSTLSNPTPAMLEIMSKMRQKASTPAAYRGEMHWARSPVQPTREAHGTFSADRRSRKDEHPQEEPQVGGSLTTAGRDSPRGIKAGRHQNRKWRLAVLGSVT